MSDWLKKYNDDPNPPRPPKYFKGKEYPFNGIVDACWVCYHSSSLDPGIYWVVATGSWWGCYDGDSFHAHCDEEFVWADGTKEPTYLDPKWGEYLEGMNFIHFPRSFDPFIE